MSVNGVQKCIMLTMYKKLQHNSEEHLQLMLKLLKLPSKYKSKTDLLIKITSYISKPQNKEACKAGLPRAVMAKLFPHDYRDENKEKKKRQKKEDQTISKEE